jgi:alanyl-tRNA synthetase
MRIEFVCGGRALRDLRFASSVLTRLAGSLTVGTDELETALARLREAEDRSRKRVQSLVEELAGFEADQLVSTAPRVSGSPLVRRTYGDRTLADLRYLAAAITVRGGIALLGLTGEKAQLVFARPAESSLDCGKLLKETLGEFGGKGGGQPAQAQGGLPDPTRLEAALDAAVQRLQAAIS